MPYPNEHAARIINPDKCDSFKRMNQGSGVSLILCINDGKSTAQAYRFDKTKFTVEQAKEWLNKHNIKPISFEPASNKGDNVNAKLSMKASNGAPEIDGRIWSAGMHHVFVNDKPARVYVPEETIMQTFNSMRGLIENDGRMPIGIDHLSDSVLSDNEILAKMNLLDVGSVSKVGTDGSSIYILDSELTNQQIKDLNAVGELPAYSIVGAMDAKPCPSGKADYVVEQIDVQRVDIVQEGGCQVCKVGAQPDNLILTSKKSMEEFDMVTASEAPVEQIEETPVVEEPVVEEVAEEKEEEVKVVEEAATEPVAEEPVVEEVKVEETPKEEAAPEEESSEMAELKKELAELKEMLGGKKPKVEAKKAESTIDFDTEFKALIAAGKATPVMKEALKKVADESEDAFKSIAASLPKFVNLKMESKLAKLEEATKKPKKTPEEEWEEQYGDLAKRFGV